MADQAAQQTGNSPGAGAGCVALDLRGLECPFVVVEILDALQQHPDADLSVLCDHANSVHQTVPAFCTRHGYELAREPLGGALFRLDIRRARPDLTIEQREAHDA